MITNEDFESIYLKYLRFSIRMANKIVKDPSLAEDISQEVFEKIYRSKKLDIQNEDKVKALIALATLNLAKDYVKKAYTRKEETVGDRMDYHRSASRFDLDAMILKMEENEYKKMVLMRFRDLYPKNYDILIKVKYLEIPPDDVANEYGITRNNVNNIIFRARKWLRAELRKAYLT